MKGLLTATALAGGVLCVSKGLDRRLETSYFNISSKKIPESFSGFKIVHLSDAHSETTPGLINRIYEEKPDIIVCTGDMTDDNEKSFSPTVSLTKSLLKIAPVYMVTGNHDLARPDFSLLEGVLQKLGAKFLHNERVILKRGDDEISLSGISDSSSLTGKKISKHINSAIKTLGKSELYDILLFHRANLFEFLDGGGFDLVLSGHMHGGQMRLPVVGGVVSPKSSIMSDSKLFRPKYFAGAYSYSDMTMIVSRGLGNPMLLPRLFNPPEMVVITLNHKKV